MYISGQLYVEISICFTSLKNFTRVFWLYYATFRQIFWIWAEPESWSEICDNQL